MIETVKIDDFETEYFKFGDGPKTMVMLPGAAVKSVMASEAAVADAYKMFRDKYTVYLFETRKNLMAGHNIEDLAEDTAKVMKALGLKDAYVFGASMGGMKGLYLAINHPELVKKLYVAATLSRQNDTSRATFGEWIRLAGGNDKDMLNKSIREGVYSSRHIEQFAEALAASEKSETAEEVRRFKMLIEACINVGCYDRLDEIKCPVYVSGCWNDNAVGSIASIEIAQRLKCSLYMYEGYSHAIYDEAKDHIQRIFNFFEA